MKKERNRLLILSSKKKNVLLKGIEEKKDHVKIDVSDPRILEQIDLINFTLKDLAICALIKPFIEESIDDIIHDFYHTLLKQPELERIIKDNSSVERLKLTLKQHIQEMFTGVIDDEYIAQRHRIAYAHVRIGLQSKWYMAAFQNLLRSVINKLSVVIRNQTEMERIILATTKIFNLEQQLVLESYEKETDRIREQSALALQQGRMDIASRISSSSEELASISEETNASLEEITSNAIEIKRDYNR